MQFDTFHLHFFFETKTSLHVHFKKKEKKEKHLHPHGEKRDEHDTFPCATHLLRYMPRSFIF
jgi:hypothetical protein